MDSIQVGLLGADRSDGADSVLVSAAEDVIFFALHGVLQVREDREGWTVFKSQLKRRHLKLGSKLPE